MISHGNPWSSSPSRGNGFQAAKDSGRYSSYQGPRHGPHSPVHSHTHTHTSAPTHTHTHTHTLSLSGVNARALLEAQELLRLEHRRRQQQHKDYNSHNAARDYNAQSNLEQGTVKDYNSQSSPGPPKGPHRQDVPPSPSQLSRLNHVNTHFS
ncbi:partitioning defective 3 homolog [Clupea harengus]|uniref:Partitioning defective 3 homolog n=1 Tax=Clupea harengus TaxID=7950 RepID=A0A6P8F4C7_CLUHA|nr:partitioning defective 3 homolog [Clupea harengus]